MPVQRFNAVYKPFLLSPGTINDLPGGRGRGGSHFISSYILYRLSQPDYFRGVIMREVHGDIRESIWREIMDRIEDQQFNPADFEITEGTMRITHKRTGNFVYAKGFRKSKGSSTAKLKSLAGATDVFIEECEEIEESDFDQLAESLRTDKAQIHIWRVWNPPHKAHWLTRRYYNLLPTETEGYYTMQPKNIPGFVSVVSTYRDNIKNLNVDYVGRLENYGNPDSPFYNFDRYQRVTLGRVSEGKRGRIYTNWKPIPLEAFRSLSSPSFYGLDFGYSNDPLALVECKQEGQRGYTHEVIYETGLTMPALIRKLEALGVRKTAPIYADSADPRSIDELRHAGYKVLKAYKGPNSVQAGIRHLQGLDMHYTENSAGLRRELEEYSWVLDSEDKATDVPEDKHNHCLDGIRYAKYHAPTLGKIRSRQ
jgi:phage terminase large subunit